MNSCVNNKLLEKLEKEGFRIRRGMVTNLIISSHTIADVVMWFYEKHGIWISVSLVPFEEVFTFEYSILNIETCLYQYGVFDSPTEAYMHAIEYYLTNRLK